MPTADHTSPEQALREYLDAYCRSYRRVHPKSFLDLTSDHFEITREGDALTIAGPVSRYRNNTGETVVKDVRNPECRKEMIDALMEMGTTLRDAGFAIGQAEPLLDATPKFLDSKEPKRYAFHIQLNAPDTSRAIHLLRPKTQELVAGTRTKEAQDEQHQVAQAIETFTHRLPKHPTTQVAAATIDSVQRMTQGLIDHHLLEANQVPDTLAYGKHTQNFVAKKLSMSVTDPSAPTWTHN